MEDYRWKEFEIRVEAYRYYLNIALQTNVFFYAITGVVLGFYLNKTTNEYLVYALLLPIIIAAVLGGFFSMQRIYRNCFVLKTLLLTKQPLNADDARLL